MEYDTPKGVANLLVWMECSEDKDYYVGMLVISRKIRNVGANLIPVASNVNSDGDLFLFSLKG